MLGNKNSEFKSQYNPYVKITDKAGNFLDKDGNIIKALTPRRSSESHIPLEDLNINLIKIRLSQ